MVNEDSFWTQGSGRSRRVAADQGWSLRGVPLGLYHAICCNSCYHAQPKVYRFRAMCPLHHAKGGVSHCTCCTLRRTCAARGLFYPTSCMRSSSSSPDHTPSSTQVKVWSGPFCSCAESACSKFQTANQITGSLQVMWLSRA